MQIRSSLWAALAAGFLLAACGGSTPPPVSPESVAPEATEATEATETAAESAPAEGDEAIVPPGEAKVGDKTKCLVSEEIFTVEEDSPKVEYEGKTYYLCCPGCAKKFQADPAKYLGSST